MKLIYILFLFTPFYLSTSTIIYSSAYIDVINGKVINNSSIVIENNIITSINSGYINIPKTDTLIDLRGKTLMP